MIDETSTRRRLATLLMDHAAGRLRRSHPEWADAMASEAATLACDDEHLHWSAGCALASYRTLGAAERAIYLAALGAGIALMAAYQWSVDESAQTLAVLALIGGALGVLDPGRSWISGVAIGLVVAAVNSFETLTGLRPAYETTAHTLLHDARWLILLAPALAASTIGRHVGRNLRSAPSAAL